MNKPICFLLKAKQPTDAQLQAGNYLKKKLSYRGLTITIETPANTTRSGTDRNGREWSTKMQNDYGYINRTEGVDGDHVDCYIGPNDAAEQVYIVHQRKAGDWEAYDEDKVMLGFDSEEEAKEAYLKHYDDPRFLGPVTAMPFDEFKEKVLATMEKPAMIKSQIVFFKSMVQPHLRRMKDGRVVSVGGYENNRDKHVELTAEEKARQGDLLAEPHVAKPKAHHEMTQAEFLAAHDPVAKEGPGGIWNLRSSKEVDDTGLGARLPSVSNMTKDKMGHPVRVTASVAKKLSHKASVRAALINKQSVPADVLADYPDLASQFVTESRQELIDEHEHLVDVLNSPSHEDDKAEAKKQAAELTEYKGEGAESWDPESAKASMTRDQFIDAAVANIKAKREAKGERAFTGLMGDTEIDFRRDAGIAWDKANEARTSSGQPFDSDSWNKARDEKIAQSREAGYTHLDKLEPTVEAMRGKRIQYVHDNGVTGVIRTVDNGGNVYVDWSDDYSAEKEMASPARDGKRTVMRSSLGRGDLKDYRVRPAKIVVRRKAVN